MSNLDKNRRKSERKEINAEVEFIFSADVITAHSVNISKSGIRLDTDAPLEIEMRFKVNGKEEEHTAKLCWAKNQGKKGFAYGFEFEESD